MDNQQAIQLFFDILKSKLWFMVFGIIILAVAVKLGKQLSTNIAGYIMFRVDKHLSLKRRIRLFDGRSGSIIDYGLNGVTVQTDYTEKVIPWEEWKGSYELYTKEPRNRREGDKTV